MSVCCDTAKLPSVNPRLIWLDCKHPLFLQALPGQTTPEGVPSFKLVLVGDGGTGECLVFSPRRIARLLAAKAVTLRHRVLNLWLFASVGKTTFVKRHLTGEFEKKYERKCQHSIF